MNGVDILRGSRYVPKQAQSEGTYFNVGYYIQEVAEASLLENTKYKYKTNYLASPTLFELLHLTIHSNGSDSVEISKMPRRKVF